MTGIGLTMRQVRYENRAFWRNPAAAFFTFVFPLLFMVIFNVVFANGSPDAGRFFTPSIIVFGVVTATYTNLAMTVTVVGRWQVPGGQHLLPLGAGLKFQPEQRGMRILSGRQDRLAPAQAHGNWLYNLKC